MNMCYNKNVTREVTPHTTITINNSLLGGNYYEKSDFWN